MRKKHDIRTQTSLCLELEPRHTLSFDLILQRGFMFIANVGNSIRSFLCDELGLSPGYVEERVSIVFLDSRPVDDLHLAIIRDGSELTLSAAMPGLVGVTLKRGSVLASFRGTITHRETGNINGSEEGAVYIKLFNLMMRELGTVFLTRGILVRASILSDFIENSIDTIRKECRKIFINGKPVEPQEFQGSAVSQGEWVFLQVVGGKEDHGSGGNGT